MHVVARVFQILFLVGGPFMVAVAAGDTGHTAADGWKCETRSIRDEIDPHQEEKCDGGGTNTAPLVQALAGVGLMIGSVSIAVGGRTTPRTDTPAAPAAPQQPYAAQPFPAQQQGQPPAQPQAFQGTPPQPPQNF
ncbi:hypothetical protein AB0I10_21100 [Streptomyces sp. NPDC050636]|uniref:hypothetical protein n=1 Tax=Streptomyces sp. NPDC050636 TaxID=3154510 RepID=UPI00344199E7